MNIFVDIETLPPLDWSEEEKRALAYEKVPANYKNPEPIEKWVEANYQDLWEKLARHPLKAHILCVGTIIEDGDRVSERLSWGVKDWADWMYQQIQGAKSWEAIWIGHNISGFDLPRLRLHLARVAPGHPLIAKIPCKAYSRDVVDTKVLAGGTARDIWLSLGELSEFFGLDGKTGHGSEVLGMYLENRQEDIAEYCMQDTRLAREIYRRLG